MLGHFFARRINFCRQKWSFLNTITFRQQKVGLMPTQTRVSKSQYRTNKYFFFSKSMRSKYTRVKIDLKEIAYIWLFYHNLKCVYVKI